MITREKALIDIMVFVTVIVMVFVYTQSIRSHEVKITKRVMTEQEFNRLKEKEGVYEEGKNYNVIINGHGTGLKPPTAEQWEEIRKMVVVVDKMEFAKGDLPSNHDNSVTNWFPPVGNQGPEGSCVSWACGYYTKTFQEAREHGWDLSGCIWEDGYTGHPSIASQGRIFSPDFIYHQVNNGADDGSSYQDNMNLLENTGCCTWDKMPYDPYDKTTWPDEAAWRQAPLYRSLTGYTLAWDTTDEQLDNLKQWLDNGNLAVISVSGYFYDSLTDNDLWTVDNYEPVSTNHANTVVGFDDNFGPYLEGGNPNTYGAFKIVNSWGVGGWENIRDGFLWISYECMKDRITKHMFYENSVGYEPKLVAVFQLSHDRRGECQTSVGVGPVSVHETKGFDSYGYKGGDHPFPVNRMVMDVTEFASFISGPSDNFYICVRDFGSETTGTIDYFSIEMYDDYLSGIPTDVYVSADPPVDTQNYSSVCVQTGEPDIALSTAEYDYGSVLIGNSSDGIIGIISMGVADLVITDVTSATTDFVISTAGFPRTVPPGGVTTVATTFAPSDTGVVAGSLAVFSNDPDEEIATVSVRGKGVSSGVTPATVDEMIVGNVVMTTGVTILNRGDVELIFRIDEMTDWLAVDPCSASVDSDTDYSVEVVMDATDLSPGEYTGEMIVTFNDPGNPEVPVPVHLRVELARAIVSLPSVTALPGGIAGMSIDLDNQLWLPEPVAGMQVELGFDDTFLTVVGVDPTARTSHMSEFDWEVPEPGELILLIFDEGEQVIAPGTGSVAGISFAVSENITHDWSTTVQVRKVVLGDTEGNSMVVEVRDGMIGFGLKCDVTMDGQINILDVLAVVNHILGTSTLIGEALDRADCNGDDNVNVLDALSIVNIILGVILECPGEGFRPALTPEVIMFCQSLKPYLSNDAYDRFIALVRAELAIPAEYILSQNYPNPFNPITSIHYSVGSDQTAEHSPLITLKIFNLLGQEVATLVEEAKESGFYTVTWDGRDASGSEVSSGVYFYRLEVGNFVETKSMVLLK